MKKRTLAPIHPGEVLAEDFMKPMEISQYRLAKELHINPTRVNEIVHGKRAITVDTANRLARFFKMEAKFWMNLQVSYDLETSSIDESKYHNIHPYGNAA